MAKAAPVSPLAPAILPRHAGRRRRAFRHRGGRHPLQGPHRRPALALLDEGTQAAGVFTRSKCPSAPVDWCREALQGGKARGLVVNSGNANAFTGKTGADAVKLTADIAAKALGCQPEEIFLASTGVIGEPLDATQVRGRARGLRASAPPPARGSSPPRPS